jgi:hypothetical protein
MVPRLSLGWRPLSKNLREVALKTNEGRPSGMEWPTHPAMSVTKG